MEESWDAILEASLIIQIAKPGKDPFANYRPIALLGVFYKLLSKLIHSRLKDPLHTFIAPFQCRVQRAKSTNDPICTARRLIDRAG
eukprot:5850474-Amphidinium_carterae.1